MQAAKVLAGCSLRQSMAKSVVCMPLSVHIIKDRWIIEAQFTLTSKASA
jgi:hypothetical protein